MKVKICKLDHMGRGIAFIDGKITFVPFSLPDEEVEIEITNSKKNYNEAKVIKYLTLSNKRANPFCPFYTNCGGCNLEHLNYDDTINFKKEKLENIFSHNSLNYPAIKVIENESPLFYRNKLSLKIVDGEVGFFESETHKLVQIDDCFLAKKSINACLKKIKKLQIKNGLVTIRANYNDELLIIIKTKDEVVFDITNYADLKIVGVVLNNKTIYGDNFFYERMNNFLFKVSFDAFFQVNPYITSKLFNILSSNIAAGDVVMDLYSGVGTLGIVASRTAKKVVSIEIVKNAVLDNLQNMKLNHAVNILPHLGDATAVIDKINMHFDTFIIDPPRKGLDKKSLDIILNNEPKKIIYISCDAITLARDLKELTKQYSIKEVYLLDMFSYTYHCETLCILERK